MSLDGNKAGEIWAIALSEDGHYLASTTYDGRINVWDCLDGRRKIREYETKGSYGMAIDLVSVPALTIRATTYEDHVISLSMGDSQHLVMRMGAFTSSITIAGVCYIRYQVSLIVI